jgi:hypothetical protein
MPSNPKMCVSVISLIFVKNNFLLDKYVAIYGTHLRRKPAKCWVWSVALFGAETCTLRKVDQKYLESYGVLCWRGKEKIGWTHCLKNKEVLHRVKKKRNILNKYLGKKGRLAGFDISFGGLLKHVFEEKVEGTKRRGRECKRLLGDLRKIIIYWNLKDEALDLKVWRIHFRRN